MNYAKSKGQLWMSSYIGATGRPEGFAATGMNDNLSAIRRIPVPNVAGSDSAVTPNMTVAGKIDVNVTVHDAKGNVLGHTQDVVQDIRQGLFQADATTRRADQMSR
jgi:hypothetical protein